MMSLKLNNIYNMDVREGLRLLDDESIDCVITSPPYWSLRDYGIPPSIWGADPECEHEFVMEIKNAISDEPTRWQHQGTVGVDLDLEKHEKIKKAKEHTIKHGFCSKCGAWYGTLGLEPNFDLFINNLCDIYNQVKRVLKKSGTCWVNLGDSYEDKDLVGIPEMFALEMKKRGWTRRNTIIWHKPNAMPSSARDRFTVDFEYVYFFVKAKKYWFEQQRERLSTSKSNRDRRKYPPATNSNFKNTGEQGSVPSKVFAKEHVQDLPSEDDFSIIKYTNSELKDLTKEPSNWVKMREKGIENRGGNNEWNNWISQTSTKPHPLGKNKRTVWKIPTKPNPEAHFATFPPKLVEPMIKSGCPESGVVLDIFAGTGTTLKKAWELGRNYLGFEISEEYTKIAKRILKTTKNKRLDGFLS